MPPPLTRQSSRPTSPPWRSASPISWKSSPREAQEPSLGQLPARWPALLLIPPQMLHNGAQRGGQALTMAIGPPRCPRIPRDQRRMTSDSSLASRHSPGTPQMGRIFSTRLSPDPASAQTRSACTGLGSSAGQRAPSGLSVQSSQPGKPPAGPSRRDTQSGFKQRMRSSLPAR